MTDTQLEKETKGQDWRCIYTGEIQIIRKAGKKRLSLVMKSDEAKEIYNLRYYHELWIRCEIASSSFDVQILFDN